MGDIPKVDEHWTCEFGPNKSKIIVKILEMPKPNKHIKNVMVQDFVCDRKGEKILVSGSCLIEKWD
ncbi:MAG: hypothetical protein PVH88_01945 [Ignavibacteria bacterium]|jgi:hypothetical protein